MLPYVMLPYAMLPKIGSVHKIQQAGSVPVGAPLEAQKIGVFQISQGRKSLCKIKSAKPEFLTLYPIGFCSRIFVLVEKMKSKYYDPN